MPTVKAAPMLPDGSLDDEGRPPAGAAPSNPYNVDNQPTPRVPDAGADPWAQLDVLDDLDERGAA